VKVTTATRPLRVAHTERPTKVMKILSQNWMTRPTTMTARTATHISSRMTSTTVGQRTSMSTILQLRALNTMISTMTKTISAPMKSTTNTTKVTVKVSKTNYEAAHLFIQN